jgi:multidrug resistance efflux pump
MQNQATEVTTAKPKVGRKKIARIFIGAIIGAVVAIAGYYAYEDYFYVSTDDAVISGDMYRIAPKVPGTISSVNIEEGNEVQKGQILMELDQQGIANVEDSILRSPIHGTVIQKTGLPGEVVGAGTSVAMIVAKENLYVEANVEETNAASIKVGQPVDITIDMYPGTTFHGKVKEVGEATQSVFSLLPPLNAGGNFTKVTQRVPIKITFTDGPYNFKPGLNAMVKIHIK